MADEHQAQTWQPFPPSRTIVEQAAFPHEALAVQQPIYPGQAWTSTTTPPPSGAPSSGVPLEWLQTGMVSSPRDAEIYRKVWEKDQELIGARGEVARLLSQQQRTAEDNRLLNQQVEELRRKERFAHLRQCLEKAARELLIVSEAFAKLFEDQERCEAFVMSVDIRGSTDLMLRATDPRGFASFIRTLCDGLAQSVFAHHGVFDRFTGDGILAFFPKFYSGEDAGFLTLQAAESCHEVFNRVYRAHRSTFTCVRADAGLGIGIDYGHVALVSDWGNLTVVGNPVVYACRLAAAPGGQTLLNQQAHAEIFGRYSAFCNTEETSLPVKGESPVVAYRVRLNAKTFQPAPPPWAAPSTGRASANASASG